MKVVRLTPPTHKARWDALLEKPISAYYNEVIFDPVIALLEEAGVIPNRTFQRIKYDMLGSMIVNASEKARKQSRPDNETALQYGLATGAIWYADGRFTGRFNAAISKELRGMGARYHAGASTFTIQEGALPADIKFSVADAKQRSNVLHLAILGILAKMAVNLDSAETGINPQIAIDSIGSDLQKHFAESVSKAGSLEVSQDISPHLAKDLRSDLEVNLDESVKSFAHDAIPDLAQRVKENLDAGGRTDRLAEIVEARKGVAERKAAFQARNATERIKARHTEESARAVGSISYVWETMHDDRVRHDHAILDGQTFYWDLPPITNRETGDRNNPGGDWNCRCVAHTVLMMK